MSQFNHLGFWTVIHLFLVEQWIWDAKNIKVITNCCKVLFSFLYNDNNKLVTYVTHLVLLIHLWVRFRPRLLVSAPHNLPGFTAPNTIQTTIQHWKQHLSLVHLLLAGLCYTSLPSLSWHQFNPFNYILPNLEMIWTGNSGMEVRCTKKNTKDCSPLTRVPTEIRWVRFTQTAFTRLPQLLSAPPNPTPIRVMTPMQLSRSTRLSPNRIWKSSQFVIEIRVLRFSFSKFSLDRLHPPLPPQTSLLSWHQCVYPDLRDFLLAGFEEAIPAWYKDSKDLSLKHLWLVQLLRLWEWCLFAKL